MGREPMCPCRQLILEPATGEDLKDPNTMHAMRYLSSSTGY